MDSIENDFFSLDTVTDCCRHFYDAVVDKVNRRYVILPATGVFLFYWLFVREISGKKRCRTDKEPCNPDEEYTGTDHPFRVPRIPAMDNWLSIYIARKLFKTVIGDMLIERLRKNGDFHLPSTDIPEEPTFHPHIQPGEEMLRKKPVTQTELDGMVVKSLSYNGFEFNTIADYITSYREGKTTPVDVANRVIDAIKASKEIKSIIEYDQEDILKLAEESAERWRNGTTLSIFDGIPVAVKDEYIVGKYHLRNGFPMPSLDHLYEVEDERGMVQKLRNGGAIFIGISNMHQCGIGAFGINQSKHHGANRNPYNPDYAPGGSSGGSASAIAAGYCPVALGTDGGGSIRIPAGACGVVGLKATYGRYSSAGMYANGMTIGHTGPLCATVRDTALCYGYLAGKDNNDERTLFQPPVFVGPFDDTDLSDFTIGYDPEAVKGCNEEIKESFMKALDWLRIKHKAKVMEIRIPEKMESVRALGKILASEMSNTNELIYCNHFNELNIDVLGMLKMGRSVSADEYLTCCRQRTRCINALKFLFTKVDAFFIPGSEEFQPKITPSREKYGHSDLGLTVRVASVGAICNLTGAPAISVPVGYSTQHNLPMSVQVVAPWWREDTLLRVAYSIEQNVDKIEPQVYFDVLNGA